MTDKLPTSEPREFALGETLRWTKDLAAYPASEHTLTYYFRGPDAGFDAEAASDGNTHVITVPRAITETLTAGVYYWQAWAEQDGEWFKVAEGETKVKPDLFAETAFDGRSATKKTLDAIDALLSGKATLDQQEYQIGNRALKRIPIPELLELRREYARLYSGEQRAARVRRGGPLFQSINVRFTRPR